MTHQPITFDPDGSVTAVGEQAAARNNEQVAGEALKCVLSWEPTACVIGNVTALELARLLVPIFTSCPACGSEPWCNIDCAVCSACAALENTDG